tara:strand:+ start:3513 stop:4472 length:960 start_codon:yes stop_codon:yes gene_type:complete
VTGPWISDTAEEIEHPTVPLGINRMAIPRAAILLSLSMIALIFISTLVVGYSAWKFLDMNQDAFDATDRSLIQDPESERWYWEAILLYDTCDPRQDDWSWPDVLSEQDDLFLLPGEVRCDWEHQGEGDRASLAIHNRGSQSLDLVLEIIGGSIVFGEGGEPDLTMTDLEANDSVVLELELIEEVTEHNVQIIVSHLQVMEAQVILDLTVYAGAQPRDIHVEDGDQIEVNYRVWDADTDEQLDEGDLLVTAGDDPAWIEGFGWSAIGLDIDSDRGLLPGISSGTSHVTLLPPSLAYGNSDDELKDRWLRYELEINRGPLT